MNEGYSGNYKLDEQINHSEEDPKKFHAHWLSSKNGCQRSVQENRTFCTNKQGVFCTNDRTCKPCKTVQNRANRFVQNHRWRACTNSVRAKSTCFK